MHPCLLLGLLVFAHNTNAPARNAELTVGTCAGTLLAYAVPAHPGDLTAPPIRLPQGHSRSVFSISCCSATAQHPSDSEAEPLRLLTVGMDRTVLRWAVPLVATGPNWRAAKVRNEALHRIMLTHWSRAQGTVRRGALAQAPQSAGINTDPLLSSLSFCAEVPIGVAHVLQPYPARDPVDRCLLLTSIGPIQHLCSRTLTTHAASRWTGRSAGWAAMHTPCPFEPAEPHRLAIGCGDGTIRLVPTSSRPEGGPQPDTKTIWQVLCSRRLPAMSI